jgi:hypothetical protein
MTPPLTAGCTDVKPYANVSAQLLSDGMLFAARLVEWFVLLTLTAAFQMLCTLLEGPRAGSEELRLSCEKMWSPMQRHRRQSCRLPQR